MVSKDQTIGGIIFLVCVVIAVVYVVTLAYPEWLGTFGVKSEWPKETESSWWNIRFWVIGIPVFLAFILVLGIGAWIGWTMATTPPPKPIEEIETETEKEEKEKEKKEE